MQFLEKFLSFKGLKVGDTSFPFLKEVYRAFTEIPYENATKIINRRKNQGPGRIQCRDYFRLPENLFREYTEKGAGGTCFSLVYALYTLLRSLSFSASIVLADRTYGVNTHTAVFVTIEDSRYLLDPGYLLPEPLLLPERGQSKLVSLPMNDLLVENFETGIRVSTIRKGTSTFRYLIKDREIAEKEFKNAWESSFDFKMMDNVFITKLTPASQIYLRENRIEIVTREKRSTSFIHGNFSAEVYRLFGLSPEITEELLKCHNLKK